MSNKHKHRPPVEQVNDIPVVEPVDETVEKEPEKTIPLGKVVDCQALRVRTIPRLDAGVLTVVKEGEIVTVVENYDNWLQVKTEDGKEGYCMKKFIEIQ